MPQAGTIQWFPGHMAKARRQMEENLKKVDFIIEIRDARIPESSTNPLLTSVGQNKPRLILLSKTDKADPATTQAWIDRLADQNTRVLALDLIHENYRAALVREAKILCAPLIEKQKRRGMRPRALRAMVAGIPNVGKSTFINTLAKRKAAKTGDRPGVTKSLQWISLDRDLELLDTPGVLWPKFEQPQVGLNLALLGSVKDDVVHMDDLALYAMERLMKEHPGAVESCYGITIADTPWETLEAIARKRGWLKKGEVDETRMMRTVVQDIRDDRLGRLSWEAPSDLEASQDSHQGADRKPENRGREDHDQTAGSGH